MSKYTKYKYCIVPMCKNTSISTPNKIFISVPRGEAVRKQWCKLMRREKISFNSSLYCCEDHFKIEEDIENYTQIKLMGNVKRMILKENVVPRRFECQNKLNEKGKLMPRGAAIKREQKRILEAALTSLSPAEYSTSTSVGSTVPLPEKPSPSSIESDIEDSNNIEFEVSNKMDIDVETKCEKSVQVRLKSHVRSKGTNARVHVESKTTSPMKKLVTDSRTSPIKWKCPAKKLGSEKNNHSPTPSFNSSSDEDYQKSNSSNDSSEEYMEDNNIYEVLQMRKKSTLLIIEYNPKLYTGLPEQCYFIINLLVKHIPIAHTDILVILKKIKLNDSYAVLSNDFGMSVSNISRIFKKSVCQVALYLKTYIIWPETVEIKKHLPIPFRARYSNVQSIIDCLEIQIEKPSNPVHQALSWSEYKKCNTVKYLISATPCGLVNFISNGFGGRASDLVIVENCGFMDHLSPGISVMADRGFKQISGKLTAKQCSLIRPPSVFAAEKCSAEEVKQAKRIAALRIHIERVIGRIREFKMLASHACIDNHLISLMDSIVIIACGIINVQSVLIK